MARSDEVLAGLERVTGVIYVALVPTSAACQNARGATARPGQDGGRRRLRFETTTGAKSNRTHAGRGGDADDGEVAHEAGDEDHDEPSTTSVPLRGSCAGGRGDALGVGRFRELGFEESSLADTRMANPRQVRDLTRRVSCIPAAATTNYYHAALQKTRDGDSRTWCRHEGAVRSFDGSVSGGRCPSRGRNGQICTEEMVNMLEDMGHDTRVDLERLLASRGAFP